MVLLDDCNFHESVRLDDFDLDRTLTLVRFGVVLNAVDCSFLLIE